MSESVRTPSCFANNLNNFYAGKLADNLASWQKLTTDTWILEQIRGFEVELTDRPLQNYRPYPLRLSDHDKRALDQAIDDFIDWGIVAPWTGSMNDIFVSTIFPVSKRDGSARVILNLSVFNECVEERHFKMDTVHDAINLMSLDCYFASVDFKHAYYSVRVAPKHRKYMVFEWRGRLWCFCALPQGLRSAPRTFTKILKPVFATLREQGHTIIGYIDDSLLIEDNPDALCLAVTRATDLFDSLGLTIHPKKSVLRPVQYIEFLGFNLDSRNMTVSLTQRKRDKIKRLGCALLRHAKCTIQELAEFIGNVVAAEPSVQNAPLHYKGLEIDRNDALRASYGNYETLMTLSRSSRDDIQWWIDNTPSMQRFITPSQPDMFTESDASLDGWGASFQGQSTGGDWNDEESELHINVLELKAAFLTLQSFCAGMHDVHIRLKMDNTTAVACVNKRGSTKKQLFELIRIIFGWAANRNIQLSAEYLPGHLNVVADRESRTHNLDMEWMVKPHLFKELCDVYGEPEIDLFATRINHQLDQYVSWRPDPHAMHVDAFTLNWSAHYLYAFPPFSVIPRLLSKQEEEGGDMLVVLPVWPTRPWFGRLLTRVVEPPLLLPRNCLRLPQDLRATHKLSRTLRLGIFRLSNRSLNCRDSHRRSLTFSSARGETPRSSSTKCTCINGLSTVLQSRFKCWHQR